ncbi:phage minor head protein [Sphingomonas sp. SORGH_AS_0879]|uniref:phage minor head protein n=1 Tax=Sphingomonas sp. SORGH_AS_0879 TaxID=3041790 RepID=UPI0027D90DCD|nr:phage minor head protein [Sphingomonas sp. SORGH_AS_0879]
MPPLRATINLPADDTVAAFEARDTLRPTVHWTEMWQADHARAFTVAKVANLDLLATIRQSLDTVMRDGGTLEQWKAGLIPELKKAGWWGMVEDKAVTGTDDPVFVGGRRLRTIYDTNLRVSRAAGRWKRIQEMKDVRPYLMYVSIGDNRTRPLHRRWGGNDPAFPVRIILPVDHPAWAIFYPPNDWRCRCSVRQLSQADMDRLGYRVTTEAELVRIGWMTADGQVGGRLRTFWRKGADKPEAVPVGIGPGFAYNPGAFGMQAVAEKATRSLEAMAPIDPKAARAVLTDLVKSDAFLETLSEPGGVFPVMVLDDAARAVLGAKNHVVVLSSDSYAKQLGQTARSAGHTDLVVVDYRKLPEIGSAPDHVIHDRDQHVVLWKLDDDRYLRAVVKVTSSRDEMYLQSFRIGDAKHLAREIGAGTRIGGAAIVDDKPVASGPEMAATTALARLGPDATRKDGRSAIQALIEAAKADLPATQAALEAFVTSDRFAAVVERMGEAPALALADDLRRLLGAQQGIVRISRDHLPAIVGDIGDLSLFADTPDRILRDGDDALLVRTVGDRTVVLRLRPKTSLLQIIALRVLQGEELAAILDLPIW